VDNKQNRDKKHNSNTKGEENMYIVPGP